MKSSKILPTWTHFYEAERYTLPRKNKFQDIGNRGSSYTSKIQRDFSENGRKKISRQKLCTDSRMRTERFSNKTELIDYLTHLVLIENNITENIKEALLLSEKVKQSTTKEI